jgi:hypothetical protein
MCITFLSSSIASKADKVWVRHIARQQVNNQFLSRSWLASHNVENRKPIAEVLDLEEQLENKFKRRQRTTRQRAITRQIKPKGKKREKNRRNKFHSNH